jgi:hypothetical protein
MLLCGGLNVDQGLKRTNQNVSFRHLIGLQAIQSGFVWLAAIVATNELTCPLAQSAPYEPNELSLCFQAIFKRFPASATPPSGLGTPKLS